MGIRFRMEPDIQIPYNRTISNDDYPEYMITPVDFNRNALQKI